MGNGQKATRVRKITSFHHVTVKYEGKFFGEPHGSLHSTTVIYFLLSKGSKLWEYRKFYDIWLSAPAVTEKKAGWGEAVDRIILTKIMRSLAGCL